MPVGFGATLLQVVPWPDLRDDLVFVESLGLDNAWVIDQFWIDEAREIPLLEAWTTLAAAAAVTSRIRIGSMVTNVANRNPGILAKQVLTVDQISGGRVHVAVGGGYYPGEHRALGIDFLDPAGRGDRLREAVVILDEALRGHTVTHEGAHYTLRDAIFAPAPTQRPRPPLWVAAEATRSLRLAARHADGIVTLGDLDRGMDESLPAFRSRMERLDEICLQEGRDPAGLRRCYFAGWADEPIFASTESAADLIGRYVEAGATDFTFYLHNPAAGSLFTDLVAAHRMASRDRLARVADEVFPLFR
jgi:alkanesulfonate monooxygenase SsuD/methylene tetrahydromethanopterin reductase-like flavin-dependent oxidoreductase (luciferase family)